jgi:hypothetical protein
MTYYDYDEEPHLDLWQVLAGFILGLAVCGVINMIW